ncbi:MAG: ADP-ribosylation factor-like protein [Promethearchaeota archaeon]
MIIQKKIVLAGLDNAGKTSIVNILRDNNLKEVLSLTPTRGVKKEIFEFDNVIFYIYDLGGQEQFRRRHIYQYEIQFGASDELIYVVDIQDSYKFDESVKYLSKILEKLEILSKIEGECYVDLSELNFSIFYHKADPNLMKAGRLDFNIELLNKKLTPIIKKYNPEISKTSIFNFHENYFRSANEILSEISRPSINEVFRFLKTLGEAFEVEFDKLNYKIDFLIESQIENIKLLDERTRSKFEMLKRKWREAKQGEIPKKELTKEVLKAFGSYIANFFVSRI